MARALNLRDSYNRILKFITKSLRQVDGNLTVNGDLAVSGALTGANGGPNLKRAVLELNTPSVTSHALTGDDTGVIVMVNNAYSSGLTINLPEDTDANIGFYCTIFVAVNQTGTLKIATANDGDIMYGSIRCIKTALQTARAFQAGASSDNIVLSGDGMGRLEGSFYNITYIGENKILVEGHAVVAGTPLTAFSTS